MGNSAKRDARKMDYAKQQRAALELRERGYSYDRIAEELGMCDRSVAWRTVQSALHEIIREPAEDVLKTEINRLDRMLVGLWAKSENGDTAATDRVLKIMERRSAYLGLDQPNGLKVEMARELDGFLAKLRASLEPDVFERVLAIVAGVDGSPGGGEATDSKTEGDEDVGDEPG